ncbi:hypothetical protein BASA81_010142 [Batrachochytrium salamandrivorans]|nr:hypothetical protein BASA81_010142 [Batrachochytrium salamandrivorans]
MEEDFSISEEDDEDEGAGSSSEEEIRKVLPQRKSRGTRRVQTVQEGDEDADEEFWSQGAWKEEENDDDIKSDEFSSGAFGDSSDSDIDYDETADVLAEEKAAANAERLANKFSKAVVDDDADVLAARKKTKYVDPALVAKRTKKTSEPVPAKRKRKPAVQIPQEDMLAEVVKTEHENKRILAEMILLQEVAKTRREASRKADDKTPRVVFTSNAKRGDRYSYSDPSTFPKAKTPPPPPKRLATLVPRYRFLGSMNQTFTNLAEYQQLVQQKAERAAQAASDAAQVAATQPHTTPPSVLPHIHDNLS